MDKVSNARQILENRGIPFSESSFIKYVRNNEHEIVKTYLEAGMSPDVLSSSGDSVLLIAAQYKNIETFNILIEAGAEKKQLLDTLDKVNSSKDFWDKLSSLSSITTVVSSLLIAAIGWYFTSTYNSRQLDSQNLRIVEQNRVKELEVVTKMLPSLTSNNEEEKKVALTVINTLGNTALATELALLNPSKGAADAIESIIANPNTNDRDKELAIRALSEIRSVSINEIRNVIENENITRKIDEVILHHTATPIANYQDEKSIISIANFEISNFKDVGFHYLISPEGKIWIGKNLNSPVVHARELNKTSVSVVLFLNGEIEEPTQQQQDSAHQVLAGLFKRLDIKPEDNFASGKGFHNDHALTACPGKLITKEMVLGWFNNP